MDNIEFIKDDEKEKVENGDFKFLKDLEEHDKDLQREAEKKKIAEDKEKNEIADYLQRTNRKNAIESLVFNIGTIQQGYKKIWSSGFDELDKNLQGGFHPKQLVVLGAVSSLGKTSLALQIADNVAKSEKDVLFFSLEMDSDELLAKTISRETYLLSCGDKVKEKYRLSTQDILNGHVGKLGDPQREIFDEALENTREINDHLFYYIGNNDVTVSVIEEAVEIHKKATGNDPLVIIDYLQILRATDDAINRRLDKRLLTDDDTTKLKVLARDKEIPIIVISAFNRESYLQPVSMSSFKESSGIEYSSDVLLGLQYQGAEYIKHPYRDPDTGKLKTVYENKRDHELRVRELSEKLDSQEVRPVELLILKNRNGQKGKTYFSFNARFNCYEESNRDPKVYDWDDVIGFAGENETNTEDPILGTV